jgi:integrase
MPLKLTRRAGSSVWWITGTLDGQRVRQSTGRTDRREAEDILARQSSRLHRAAVFGQEAVVEWGDALASYLDANPQKAGSLALLDKLNRVMDGKLLREINQAALDQAIRILCRPGAAPATKQRNVIVPLKAVLNHAARRGWCSPPAFETPKGAGGVKRTRWLTPAEWRRLETAAAPHLRPLLVFLVGCGTRLSEALELEWEAVDLAHARAVVWQKQGNERTLDLPPAVVAALANLPGRDGRVFRTDDGKPYRDTQRTSGGQIKTAFMGACRRAQVRGVTPHTLRHTWASWRMLYLNGNAFRLRIEGGWASTDQVDRYAKLVPDSMLPEIKAAWGLVGLASARSA